MKKSVEYTLGIIAVLIIIGSISYYQIKNPDSRGGGIACTQDARQCPDGSYVGRVAPLCDFTACPAPKPIQKTAAPSVKTPTTTSTTSTTTVKVTYTDKGFSPATTTIKVGSTVVFTNASNKSFWPASNDHPAHILYPEFDPKTPIVSGGTFTFTFEKVGTWRYHNHLLAKDRGVIQVNE